LAWRANIHRTYLADIERGKRNVTLRTVANLAKTLRITIGHLFAQVTAPGAVPELVPGEVRDILLVEHHVVAAAERRAPSSGQDWRIQSRFSATERPG